MANNATPKLKAFVQVDSTGRVVSGTPVFRASKPKSGTWREIPTYYRGDGNTTTTTTQNPNLYNAGFIANGSTVVCNNQGQFNLPLTVDPNVCSNGNMTLNSGTYPDYGIPNGSMIYINLKNGNIIQVNTYNGAQMSYGCTSCGGSTTSTTSTTTTTTTEAPVVFTVANQRWGSTAGDACSAANPLTTFFTTGPLQFGNYLQDGNVIYLDEALTQRVQYPFIQSPGIGRLLDCNNGVLSNQRSCF